MRKTGKPSVTDMRNPVDGASAESSARHEMKEVSKHEMKTSLIWTAIVQYIAVLSYIAPEQGRGFSIGFSKDHSIVPNWSLSHSSAFDQKGIQVIHPLHCASSKFDRRTTK